MHPNLALHCWGQRPQQLPPPLPLALHHRLALGGHREARVQLHYGLEDQQGLAGLRGVHQLVPDLQLVPERMHRMQTLIQRDDSEGGVR